MPMIDMPLKDLKVYNGKNPKPDDFDSYWEKALLEMHSVKSDVQLVPAEFQAPYADCYHMYYTGVDGARIHAQLTRPKNISKASPAIVLFHGLGGGTGDWSYWLNYAAMGFTVAHMDCRGQGGLSEDIGAVKGSTWRGHLIRGIDDSPEKLLYRQIYLDVAQLVELVMDMPNIDENKVGVFGGSQGGGLGLIAASLVPRVKLATVWNPYLCDYKRVWEMDLAKGAYEDLAYYFTRFDPLHKRESEFFEKLGYIDVQHFCDRIKAKVLMGICLMDNTCPPSTQFAAYNKIRSDKEVLIYPDFDHTVPPLLLDIIFQLYAKL